MAGTRLFVGGLGCGMTEYELRQKLGSYGTLVNLELKEKKDVFSGDIVKRFAFATLDAPNSRVDQCIGDLSGQSFYGSIMKVERAQESFIERLKREREARLRGAPQIAEETLGANRSVSFNFNYQDQKRSLYGVSRARDRTLSDSDAVDKQKLRPRKRERVDSDGGSCTERDKKSRKEVTFEKEQELFPSSLKSYSSVWTDEKMEGIGDDEQLSLSMSRASESSERQLNGFEPGKKWTKIDRYDPSKKSSQVAVVAAASNERPRNHTSEVALHHGKTKVSADLRFGSSNEFSFLKMFEDAQPIIVTSKEEEDESVKMELVHIKSSVDQKHSLDSNKSGRSRNKKETNKNTLKDFSNHRPMKRFKFFVDDDDPEVEENLRWVYQQIPEDRIKKFKEDSEEICKLYRDRHRAAMASLREHKINAGRFQYSGPVDTTNDDALRELHEEADQHVALVSDETFVSRRQNEHASTIEKLDSGRRKSVNRSARSKNKAHKDIIDKKKKMSFKKRLHKKIKKSKNVGSPRKDG